MDIHVVSSFSTTKNYALEPKSDSKNIRTVAEWSYSTGS